MTTLLSAPKKDSIYTNRLEADSLFLWWLGQPEQPRLVGTLRLTDRHRRVSLEYDAAWLTQGFALSEDLPLQRGEFVPSEQDTVAGAVDDARPDRWGERVIRHLYRPARLSLLEYLFFAGDDRFGALGVSQNSERYNPSPQGPLAVLKELHALAEVVHKVVAGEPVDELQSRLIRPGATLGGVRPKSLMTLDGEPWVVKFSDGQELDMPLIEHACMQLARRCGIHTADTRALPLLRGHAVAVRRFDRVDGQRVHAISAHVALRAAGEEFGYPELAQLLRRLGQPEQVRAQQSELFARMVFNLLMDNTDDHEKNHALLRNSAGYYELAPAFDVLPAAQGLGYQQMRVGLDGALASMDNALSQVRFFGLSAKQAQERVQQIRAVASSWKDFFVHIGVTSGDIDELARFITPKQML